jgi:hypothetical protein
MKKSIRPDDTRDTRPAATPNIPGASDVPDVTLPDMNTLSHPTRSICLEIAPVTASAWPASVNRPRRRVTLRKQRRPHCFKLKGNKNNPDHFLAGAFCRTNLVT